MKKAIFTICAKNYLGQAKTLGTSLRKYAPEADFFILLSDELDGLEVDGFDVIESKNINIPSYYEMAFKYDVIEFSTSIKPFFIDKLFNDGYENIIYLDPDMVVYNRLDLIWESLLLHSAIITPHLIKPYIEYQGATAEEELLFVGIYNLGFFSVTNTLAGRNIIDWWKAKLADQCYADKEDALHVDQKWMDFLPALYGNDVLVLRHPGVNIAFWNMHERTFVDDGVHYSVDNESLLIFHFSGFDHFNYGDIARKQTKYNLKNSPQYKRLFEDYVDGLKYNGVEELSKLRYTYNFYNNGVGIVKFQRRLYRTIENKKEFTPFCVESGSFYMLLDSNRLLIKDADTKYQNLNKGFDVNKTVNKGLVFLRILKFFMGIKKYYLLMKFLSKYSRFENQTFLLKNKDESRN